MDILIINMFFSLFNFNPSQVSSILFLFFKHVYVAGKSGSSLEFYFFFQPEIMTKVLFMRIRISKTVIRGSIRPINRLRQRRRQT